MVPYSVETYIVSDFLHFHLILDFCRFLVEKKEKRGEFKNRAVATRHRIFQNFCQFHRTAEQFRVIDDKSIKTSQTKILMKK